MEFFSTRTENYNVLEVLLDTGKTIDDSKALRDEELVEIVSSFLLYLPQDAEADGIISAFFQHSNLTKQERATLEAIYVLLFSTYSLSEDGKVVQVVLK